MSGAASYADTGAEKDIGSGITGRGGAGGAGVWRVLPTI